MFQRERKRLFSPRRRTSVEQMDDKATKKLRCSGSTPTRFPHLNIKESLIPTDQDLRKHPALITRCQMLIDKRTGHHRRSEKSPFCTSVKMFERTSSESCQKVGPAELSANHQRQSDEVEQISQFTYEGSNGISSAYCPRLIRTIVNLVGNTTMNQKLIRGLTERCTGHQRRTEKKELSSCTSKVQQDSSSSDTDVPSLTGTPVNLRKNLTKCRMSTRGLNEILISQKRKSEKPEISNFTQKEQQDISSSETHITPLLETRGNFVENTTKSQKTVRGPSSGLSKTMSTGHQRRTEKRELYSCTFMEQQDVSSSDIQLPPLIATPSSLIKNTTKDLKSIKGLNKTYTGHHRRPEKPQIPKSNFKKRQDISSPETQLPPLVGTSVTLVKNTVKGLKSSEGLSERRTCHQRRIEKRELSSCTFKEQQDVSSSETHLPPLIGTPAKLFKKSGRSIRGPKEIHTDQPRRTEKPQISYANFKEQQEVSSLETHPPSLITTPTNLIKNTTKCRMSVRGLNEILIGHQRRRKD